MNSAPPRIVITGPTGWIGTALLATISARRSVGWGGSVRLFGSSARTVPAPDGTLLEMQALQDIRPEDIDGAIVVHLAYLTKEKATLLGSRRFLDTNLAIDEPLLAALRVAAPRAVFIASSGAAALAADGRDRHLYGMAKLIQEDKFLEAGLARGIPILAGRIFNIAGPYINKVDSYAIGSFLTQAFETGQIEINARVPVYRSYLDVGDLCSIILTALEAGHGSTAPVDLCGTEIVEMQDIAYRVASIAGIDRSAVRRAAIDYDRPSIYLGCCTDTRTLALRFGVELTSFSRQVENTAAFIRTSQEAR